MNKDFDHKQRYHDTKSEWYAESKQAWGELSGTDPTIESQPPGLRLMGTSLWCSPPT